MTQNDLTETWCHVATQTKPNQNQNHIYTYIMVPQGY